MIYLQRVCNGPRCSLLIAFKLKTKVSVRTAAMFCYTLHTQYLNRCCIFVRKSMLKYCHDRQPLQFSTSSPLPVNICWNKLSPFVQNLKRKNWSWLAFLLLRSILHRLSSEPISNKEYLHERKFSIVKR